MALQHTNISPEATHDDILCLLDEALDFGFDGVMVQPCWIATCRVPHDGTGVKVCSAMAYPIGGALTRSKAAEIHHLAEEGAQEVDAMANIGFLVSDQATAYQDEVAALVAAAGDIPVKVMLELETLPRALWATAIRSPESRPLSKSMWARIVTYFA